ncbi:MAG: dTMP kinase [Holosporales bacterium]|jgi:dTMP kinase|nr:dTMP kinase [Holosporales bacterium]
MNSTGKFITLEGGDGTGKTTQIRLLVEYLNSVGIKTIATREPGGTELGEKVRQLLRSTADPVSDPLVEVLLFFAARRQLVKQIIFPALQSGIWVVSDRFYDSSLIYQGVMKSCSIEHIMNIKHIVMENFEPDLTIVLDLSVKDMLYRINQRQGGRDLWDNMPPDYHKKVRDGFKKLAKTFSFRTTIVKASGPVDLVQKRLRDMVREKLILK